MVMPSDSISQNAHSCFISILNNTILYAGSLTHRLILSPPSWAQVLQQEPFPTISQFCQLLFSSRLPSLLTVLGSLHCLLRCPLMAAHSFPFVVVCFLQGALWQQHIDLDKFAVRNIFRNNLCGIALCDHWGLDPNVCSFNLSLSNVGSFRASPCPSWMKLPPSIKQGTGFLPPCPHGSQWHCPMFAKRGIREETRALMSPCTLSDPFLILEYLALCCGPIYPIFFNFFTLIVTVFTLPNADLWLGLSQNKQQGLMLELPVLSAAANGTLAFFHFLSLLGAGFKHCLSATSGSLSVLPVLVKCVACSLLLMSCRKVTSSVLLLLSQTNTTFLLTHNAFTNICAISNQCLYEWSYKMPEDSREGERAAPTMYP